MADLIHIPFYATVFRGDQLEEALAEIGPVALRYDADHYRLTRSTEDRYKFLLAVGFDNKLDFERYWYGPEFSRWRSRYQSWYQIPLVYDPQEMVSSGVVEVDELAGREGGPTA
jgi:hypothetical protein